MSTLQVCARTQALQATCLDFGACFLPKFVPCLDIVSVGNVRQPARALLPRQPIATSSSKAQEFRDISLCGNGVQTIPTTSPSTCSTVSHIVVYFVTLLVLFLPSLNTMLANLDWLLASAPDAGRSGFGLTCWSILPVIPSSNTTVVWLSNGMNSRQSLQTSSLTGCDIQS